MGEWMTRMVTSIASSSDNDRFYCGVAQWRQNDLVISRGSISGGDADSVDTIGNFVERQPWRGKPPVQ